MKIVVIGGTGLVGTKVVANLREHGHEAVAAAPSTGVNTLTGEGLVDVLAGAAVVVDVSNSPSFEDAAVLEFFEVSTQNLLDAAAEAGVGHYVALSVVGARELPDSGYLRAKVAQEKLIEGSSIPFSIVQATQFFEFTRGIADTGTEGGTLRVAPVSYQPMASDDVARLVAEAAIAASMNGPKEIGGPERFRMDEFFRNALAEWSDPREVAADPRARYFGTELSERSLVPGDDATLGEIRYRDWPGRLATGT